MFHSALKLSTLSWISYIRSRRSPTRAISKAPLYGEEEEEEELERVGRCLIKISLNTQRCNLNKLAERLHCYIFLHEILLLDHPFYLRQNPSNSKHSCCASSRRVLALFLPSFFFSLSLSYFLQHRYSYNETAINEARPGAPAISSIRVTSMGERRGRGEEEDRF